MALWVGTAGKQGPGHATWTGHSSAGCPTPTHPSVRPQNWAGMRCPYKLLRMVLALVCSEYGASGGGGGVSSAGGDSDATAAVPQ